MDADLVLDTRIGIVLAVLVWEEGRSEEHEEVELKAMEAMDLVVGSRTMDRTFSSLYEYFYRGRRVPCRMNISQKKSGFDQALFFFSGGMGRWHVAGSNRGPCTAHNRATSNRYLGCPAASSPTHSVSQMSSLDLSKRTNYGRPPTHQVPFLRGFHNFEEKYERLPRLAQDWRARSWMGHPILLQ